MNEGKINKNNDKEEKSVLDFDNLDNDEFFNMIGLARTQDTLDPYILSNTDIDITRNQEENEGNINTAQNSSQSAQSQMMQTYLSLQETEIKIYLNKIIGFFLTMTLGSAYLLLMINFNVDAYNMFIIVIVYLGYFGMYEVFWAPKLLNEIWRDSDDFYKLGDIVSFLLFLVVLILRLNRLIPVCFYVCAAFLFSSIIYWYNTLTPPKDQIWEYLTRCYYLIQVLMITFKVDGFLTLKWSIIFIPSWLYFGFLSFFFAKSLRSLFLRFNRDHVSSTNFKITGFLWHFGCRISILSLMLLLAGFSESRAPTLNFRLLSYSSCTVGLLNIALLITTIMKKQIIIKFIMTFKLANSNVLQYSPEELIEAGEKMKKISFEVQNNKAYFFMISSTYFFPLNQIHISKKKDIINKIKLLLPNSKSKMPEPVETKASQIKSTNEMHLNQISRNESEEKNLCYVCCKNMPNVIFSNCGHGGICYDCAVASVKQKDGCLQCRRKIYAIHVIDHDQKWPHIVKCIQLYKLIKT